MAPHLGKHLRPDGYLRHYSSRYSGYAHPGYQLSRPWPQWPHLSRLPSGAFRGKGQGRDRTAGRCRHSACGRTRRQSGPCPGSSSAAGRAGRGRPSARDGRHPGPRRVDGQRLRRIADWDLSTRKANEYIMNPWGDQACSGGTVLSVKIRGPLLDLLYAQLRRCGDHACTGKPFTEHRNVPVLTIDPASGQPAWQQVVNAIGDAIRCGVLPPGEPLPSVREMSTLQGVPVATLQHALGVLADDGLLVVRQGRTAVVVGDAGPDRGPGRAPRDGDHDCRRAGCKPHICRPMTAKTIRNIHSILSGALRNGEALGSGIAGNPAEFSVASPAASATAGARHRTRGRRQGDCGGPQGAAQCWRCTCGWSRLHGALPR